MRKWTHTDYEKVKIEDVPADWSMCREHIQEHGGYAMKITHHYSNGESWNQWTPRPFAQGYGCDGATDSSIHLIGMHLLHTLRLDYVEIYKECTGDVFWVGDKEGYDAYLDDWVRPHTILPDPSPVAFALLVCDLYQINERAMSEYLENQLVEWGIDLPDMGMVDNERKKYMARALQCSTR